MKEVIIQILERISLESIPDNRKMVLHSLKDYLQDKVNTNQSIRLNFICTHNSRRSHITQIWAQTMAFYFGIKDIYCYSGGTEVTAMFPKVAETLESQGFQIQKLSDNENPVYAVKYADTEVPIICFSKKYSNKFNPQKDFGAIMTCSNADEGCPLVTGAEARFSIKYDDPKSSDNTPEQTQIYAERSLQIAAEMFYVFSQIIK
jgi:arsenate reductase